MSEHRWGLLAIAAVVIVITARTLAQTPPPAAQTPAAAQAPAAAQPAPASLPADYTFTSGAGLLFYYVDPGKAADFEAVLGRLREALAKTDAPQSKQQALNWRIYRSAEPVTSAAVYVFAFDPAIAAANYDPLLLIAQVLPAEAQPLYERLKAAIVKVERMGLTKIR